MRKRKLRAFFISMFILNFTNSFCQETSPKIESKTEKKSNQTELQITINEKSKSNQNVLLKYNISRFNSIAIIRKQLYC